MTDEEHNDLVDKIGDIVFRLTLRQPRPESGKHPGIGVGVGLPPPPNPVAVWDGLCRAGVIRPEHPKSELLGIVTAVYRHLGLPCPRDAIAAFFDIRQGGADGRNAEAAGTADVVLRYGNATGGGYAE